MNKIIQAIQILTISFIIAFFIISSLLGGYHILKEEERKYFEQDKIILKELKKTNIENFSDIKKKNQLEEINNSITLYEQRNKNEEVDINALKDKKKFENKITSIIKSTWEKPIDYKTGSGCNIDFYFHRNKFRYDINECTSNALFKRSVELSILKSIDENIKTQIKEYDRKNKLKVVFYP